MNVNLLFRNLLFTILQPGIVVGLIPYWMIHLYKISIPDFTWSIPDLLILILFVSGFLIMSYCIHLFIEYGEGTLSPLDPTQQLVTKGLYMYSRNPMYIGVMMMLFALTLFCWSIELGLYSLTIFFIFNLFIIFREEPRLQKTFGNSYTDYQKKVRRWI